MTPGATPAKTERRRRQRWWLLLLLLPAIAWLLRLPWRPWHPPSASTAQFSAPAFGTLEAGAAKVDVAVDLPAARAGYGPFKPQATRQQTPLSARALAVRVGEQKWTLLSLDLLLIPPALAESLRSWAQENGRGHLWVVATHSHSSTGGIDRRWGAQLSGTGRYSAKIFEAWRAAGQAAAEAAQKNVGPAEYRVQSWADDLFAPRSGDSVQGFVTRAEFQRSGGTPIAEWWLLAGHPTLVPSASAVLDADFPGALSRRQEALGRGIALVSQTACGNARVAAAGQNPDSVAAALVEAAPSGEGVFQSQTSFSWARALVDLPEPDSSQWVPAFFAPWIDKLLVPALPNRVELESVQLAGLTLVAVPFEPTWAVAQQWALADPSHQVLALANGYYGYADTAEAWKARSGESSRQLFGEELSARLGDGVNALRKAKP